jgi:NADH-ubiquinone oxidoreductase chain 4
MILAGILLKLGGYGIIRIATNFIKLNLKIAPIIMRISLIGAVITRFICIRQTDVKSLIAYSSVSHIGLVTGGILSNTP